LAEAGQDVVSTEEQDSAQASIAAAPDFRVRVARERREQMRARLLAATFTVYHSASHSAPAVIDDVIRSAGVSRGTFYKYFVSLEEAVAELGSQMALDLLQRIKDVYRDVDDPVERVVGGALMPLARAAIQPRWGAFTSRVDFTQQSLSRDGLLLGFTMDSLLQARDESTLSFESVTAAVDLILGVVVEGMRRSVNGQPANKGYIRALLVMILRGLGAEGGVAARTVASAWNRFESRAKAFDWWRELSE